MHDLAGIQESVITAFCVHTSESSVMCHTFLCEIAWNGSEDTDVFGWRGSHQKIAEERVSMCGEIVFKSLPRSGKLWRLNLQKWIKRQKSAVFVQVHSSINNWSYHSDHIQEGGGCLIQRYLYYTYTLTCLPHLPRSCWCHCGSPCGWLPSFAPST